MSPSGNDTAAKLRAILNNTQQAFVLIGPDRMIEAFNRVANENARAIAGRPMQEGDLIYDYIPGNLLDEFKENLDAALAGQVLNTERAVPTQSDYELWFAFNYTPVVAGEGQVTGVCLGIVNITERKQSEAALRRIEWLLTKQANQSDHTYDPPRGNLAAYNTHRLILDSVGEEVLQNIAQDFIDVLETSMAVYEQNGDYALGIFASGWCKFLDTASSQLPQTDDVQEALNSGKWHCHESCWTEASLAAIESKQPIDIACRGGIRLYAVPIWAGEEVIGAINFGHGDPPTEEAELQKIASRYQVDVDTLHELASQYESRPPFIVEVAKQRLETSARLIGEIVERKRIEERYRTISEITSDYAYSTQVGADGSISNEWVTGAFERITGYTPDEFYAMGGWQALIHPEDTETTTARLKTLLSGSADVSEFRIITKNGETRWLRDHGKPIWNEQQQRVIRIHGAVTDITDQKKAEQALLRSEERHRIVSGLISDYVYSANLDNDGLAKTEWITGAFERITGYTADEIIGKTDRWHELIHPDDLPMIKERQAQLADYHTVVFEYRIKTASGQWRWLRDYVKSVWDEKEQRVAHIMGAVQDITDMKQQEELQKRIIRSLEELAGTTTQTTMTARHTGQAALSASDPVSFDKLVGLYTEIVHRAVDLQAYRIDYPKAAELRSVAKNLGQLEAGPRDVVELHTTAIKRIPEEISPQRKRALVEEGRLVLVELMGYLVSYYRHRAVDAENKEEANP